MKIPGIDQIEALGPADHGRIVNIHIDGLLKGQYPTGRWHPGRIGDIIDPRKPVNFKSAFKSHFLLTKIRGGLIFPF